VARPFLSPHKLTLLLPYMNPSKIDHQRLKRQELGAISEMGEWVTHGAVVNRGIFMWPFNLFLFSNEFAA
jgi:hypothetical protein